MREAAFYGRTDEVRRLLAEGVDVTGKDTDALLLASKEGHKEVVRLLLGAGARVDLRVYGSTALSIACEGGHLEVADLLVKAGADLELGNPKPLVAARQGGHLELVRYLEKAESTSVKNKGMKDFLIELIQKKKADLECPVCLQTAEAPIFTCPEILRCT